MLLFLYPNVLTLPCWQDSPQFKTAKCITKQNVIAACHTHYEVSNNIIFLYE